MTKLNLEKILTFKPYKAMDPKLYRRNLALKLKKLLEDDTMTDDETKTDDQMAVEQTVYRQWLLIFYWVFLFLAMIFLWVKVTQGVVWESEHDLNSK